MKHCVATLMMASALTLSVIVIRQKARAQNTSPQPMDPSGAMMAADVGAKANNQTLSSPVMHLSTENRNN